MRTTPRSYLRARARRTIRAVASAVLTAAMISAGLFVQPVAAPAPSGTGSPSPRRPGLHPQADQDRRGARRQPDGGHPCGALVAQPARDHNQIPDCLTSYGLRTVDGSCNNLIAVGRFAAADQMFPRLTTPRSGGAETSRPPAGRAPGADPLRAEVGQRVRLPAARDQQPDRGPDLDEPRRRRRRRVPGPDARAIPGVPPAPPTLTRWRLPPVDGVPGRLCRRRTTRCSSPTSPPTSASRRRTTRCSPCSASSSTTAWTRRSRAAATVFVPLKADDPLIAGPDGTSSAHGDDLPASQRVHGPDPGAEPARRRRRPGHGRRRPGRRPTRTRPYVDQSQTYTSHPSHQVFLREYVDNAAGTAGRHRQAARRLPPAPTAGGMAHAGRRSRSRRPTCSACSSTTRTSLNIPMIAVDPYGKFIPGPRADCPST